MIDGDVSDSVTEPQRNNAFGPIRFLRLDAVRDPLPVLMHDLAILDNKDRGTRHSILGPRGE